VSAATVRGRSIVLLSDITEIGELLDMGDALAARVSPGRDIC
jgi:hypothetical protein